MSAAASVKTASADSPIHEVLAERVDCVYLVANGVCLLLTRRVFAALRRSGARDRLDLQCFSQHDFTHIVRLEASS